MGGAVSFITSLLLFVDAHYSMRSAQSRVGRGIDDERFGRALQPLILIA